MEEQQSKPIPMEAAREFKGVLERIAQVDVNFGVLRALNHPAPVAGDGETLFHPLHAFRNAPTAEDDEYEDAGPEKEGLDEETGEEFDIEPTPVDGWPKKPSLYMGQDMIGNDEDEQSDIELAILEPKEEEEDFEIPELTPEIMMKMFANMQQHGLI